MISDTIIGSSVHFYSVRSVHFCTAVDTRRWGRWNDGSGSVSAVQQSCNRIHSPKRGDMPVMYCTVLLIRLLQVHNRENSAGPAPAWRDRY